MFPRLCYLRLGQSLIQAHLDIFEYLRPLFTAFLESEDNPQLSSKSFRERRSHMDPAKGGPAVKTSKIWRQMTLTQQYEAAFGGACDPSRKKIEDLPY
jgi:hypothetical protein